MTIHHEDDRVTLHHGDCLEVMASLPDSSVDAICTDPPYGLGFMGKAWDDLPPGEDWARECLRVLRPGGHLLAFGGTRTWHRLACAVEDAGFEVRDSIAWLYGSGFPKSLDVSKAIDKMRVEDRGPMLAVRAWLNAQRLAAGITLGQINAAFGLATNGGGNASNWTTHPTNIEVPSWEKWEVLRALIGFGPHMDAEVWRLNGRKGKPGDAWENADVISVREGAMAGWSMDGTTKFVDREEKAPATDAAREWAGWGTALKPAFEPVVVARKPLIGTIAQNVLTHGTGALNIAATRIRPTDSDGSTAGYSSGCTCPSPEDARTNRTPNTPPPASSDGSLEGRSDLPPSAPEGGPSCPRPQGSQGGCPSSPCSCGGHAQSAEAVALASVPPLGDALAPPAPGDEGTRNPQSRSKPCPKCTAPNVEGRWPANVILDEDMAGVLDQMSGTSKDGVATNRNRDAAELCSDAGWGFRKQQEDVGYGGQGGASRFFYVAKAPKRERPVVDGVAHPTVKPLALMRWLVRLVTPPGGTVLEPFAGSGTTVEACLLEGFRCIAIEKGDEYLPLILARIARQAAPLPEAAELVHTTDPDAAIVEQITGQLDIFGEGVA